jgi:hypothetical protein
VDYFAATETTIKGKKKAEGVIFPMLPTLQGLFNHLVCVENDLRGATDI